MSSSKDQPVLSKISKPRKIEGATACGYDDRRDLLEKVAICAADIVDCVEKSKPLHTKGIKQLLKALGFFQVKVKSRQS